jgi:hypothetical protein
LNLRPLDSKSSALTRLRYTQMRAIARLSGIAGLLNAFSTPMQKLACEGDITPKGGRLEAIVRLTWRIPLTTSRAPGKVRGRFPRLHSDRPQLDGDHQAYQSII